MYVVGIASAVTGGVTGAFYVDICVAGGISGPLCIICSVGSIGTPDRICCGFRII